jgi:hypothetical protein
MKKESSSTSSSGSKECNWCRKDLPDIESGHIWTQYKELNAQRDKNGANTAPPIQEVANSVRCNSSNWIIDTSTCSHIAPDRNCFESLSLVRPNIVLADKTQVAYTGIGSVRVFLSSA